MLQKILAIDIGGSKIMVGIVDCHGNILCSQKQFLPATYDIDYVINVICQLSESFLQHKPVAAGVSIPGLTDPEQGIWKYAPFSGIAEIPIASILSEKLGLKVYIENDVNSCAIGEKVFGKCKDETDFLWITVSNGIGAAVFLNGSLYTGADGNAGELGHLTVEDHTEFVCGCGKTGCLEAMASGKGIENAYFHLSQKRHTAKEIAELAFSGDSVAKHVYEQAGYYIGKAIASSINLLNIKKIILGGGVSLSFELLEPAMQEAISRYVFQQANQGFSVETTGLGYHAALLGAAAVAQKNLPLYY